MASLETRNGRFRIVFRLEGQKFSKTLDTKNPKAANVTLAKLEHRLGQYEIGGLVIPTGCDPVEFLLNGSLRQKSAPAKKRPTETPSRLSKPGKSSKKFFRMARWKKTRSGE